MKLRISFRNPNTYIILALDAALFFLAYWLAYWLRFESMDEAVRIFFQKTVGPIIGIKLVIFSLYGLQGGMWRYTGVTDLLNIIKASAVSFALIMVGVLYFFLPSFHGYFSRSVFIIDAINTVALIGMFRLSIRLAYSSSPGIDALLGAFIPSRPAASGGGAPALIYGTDERAELLLRSLIVPSGKAHYNPVGFIDDNTRHSGVRIHGYQVLGDLSSLEEIAKRFKVRDLLVASRVSGEKYEEINTLCKSLNVACRVVPAFLDGVNKKIDISSLRNIQIEDLLSREPAPIDYSRVEKIFRGARVMITGAGGSIGGQLVRQIAEFRPASMILIDKGENYLHQIEMDLVGKTEGTDIFYHCVDITNTAKMARIFEASRPQFVFHAAAHKHVPMMERNRDEAIRNNVGGMKVVADMAERYGVERFILISTDKAVNPANVMGATKRMCELYLKSKSQNSQTQYMAVRFGNVLGSNGSVVPLFMRQIENRGPVTVTHPDIERFFMTIPEAVLLILQTVTIGKQGELYLLDMGKPVKIVDLARKMITIAGYVPGKDIEIMYTGLRPGEKLYEELTGAGETLHPTTHGKINRVESSGEYWRGVEDFVDYILKRAVSDPDTSFREMVEWLGRAKAADSAKIVPFPQKQGGK